MQWFAAAHLRRETGLTSWEEVGKQDIQRWIVRLLDRYGSAYASNQFRALQQFFKWLAAGDGTYGRSGTPEIAYPRRHLDSRRERGRR